MNVLSCLRYSLELPSAFL